jgi:hypothetical protein
MAKNDPINASIPGIYFSLRFTDRFSNDVKICDSQWKDIQLVYSRNVKDGKFSLTLQNGRFAAKYMKQANCETVKLANDIKLWLMRDILVMNNSESVDREVLRHHLTVLEALSEICN